MQGVEYSTKESERNAEDHEYGHARSHLLRIHMLRSCCSQLRAGYEVLLNNVNQSKSTKLTNSTSTYYNFDGNWGTWVHHSHQENDGKVNKFITNCLWVKNQ